MCLNFVRKLFLFPYFVVTNEIVTFLTTSSRLLKLANFTGQTKTWGELGWKAGAFVIGGIKELVFFSLVVQSQESMSKSMQLHYIPVTAFS